MIGERIIRKAGRGSVVGWVVLDGVFLSSMISCPRFWKITDGSGRGDVGFVEG